MAMKIVTSTENLPYEEWLEYRKTGIGGSDASVVCGINRYKSPVELWMEKVNNFPPQDAGESAYWGTQLESLVRAEFTMRTNIEVSLVKQLLQSEEHTFMLANLDGVCNDPIYGDCIFEAKTASAFKANEWEDAIPDEYMLQVQHYRQLLVIGINQKIAIQWDFPITYEMARAYQKANGKYLRQNQWEDITLVMSLELGK